MKLIKTSGRDFNSSRHDRRAWLRAAALAPAVLALRPAAGAVVNSVWTDSAGGNNWSNAGNWSPSGVPNDGGGNTYNVSIGTPAPTNLDITATIENLNVSAGGVLNIPYHYQLTVNGPTLVDNGSIVVNSNTGGAQATLGFGANTTLSGTGTIILQQPGTNAYIAGAAGVVLTQSAGHTISGFGAIGVALTNNGTVTANSGNLLYVNANVTNNSVLKAVIGGSLYLNGITVTQGAGGVINAAAGSLVTLASGTVTGGTITSVGTGAFQNSGTSLVSNVTNTGTINVPFNTQLNMSGTITDAGTIVVDSNSGGAVATLNFSAGSILAGTGSVVLQQPNPNAQIDGSLTQSAGHSIVGYGVVNATLTNNGTVNGNVGGTSMVFQPATATNNSLFEATVGGNLNINGTALTQAATAQVFAGQGSSVTLTNAAIIGGNLSSAPNTAAINVPSNAGYFTIQGVTAFNSVTNTAVVNLPYNQVLNVNGNLVDNGTIVINSNTGGAITQLNVAGGIISGTGTWVLQQPGVNAQITGSLNQSAGHTINGYGVIYAAVTNKGLINSNVPGNTLYVIGTSVLNQSTIEATGGQLYIDSTAVNNSTGAINAPSGQIVLSNGTNISGGTISATAPANVLIQNYNSSAGYSAKLTNLTITAGTEVDLPYNNQINVAGGTVTNNGTIVVDSNTGGALAELYFTTNTALNGSGTVLLQQGANNAQFTGPAGVTVTTSATQTISGYGTIAVGLVNNHVVAANIGGQRLTLNSYNMANNAMFQASSGGELFIDGITINQSAAAVVSATTASQVTLNNATISGGNISSAGTGQFVVANGTSTFASVNSSAYVLVPYNSTLNITGNYVDNGSMLINQNGGGAVALVNVSGGTISGSGTWTLNSYQDDAQIAGTLAQSAGHGIVGYGAIEAAFTNNGLVNSNVGNQAIYLQGSNKTNNAVIEATGTSNSVVVSGITLTQAATATLNASSTCGVSIINSTLISGTINGPGQFTIGGTSAFNSVSSNAPVLVPYNQVLTINGNYVDAGSILINQNGGGAVALVNVSGGTVSGSGVWTLNSYDDNAQIAGTLTQSTGHSIVGYGAIEATFTNNGLVNANISGNSIFLQGSNKTNNSVIESTAGGNINVNGITLSQPATGFLNAATGSTVTLTNANISGGTINGPGVYNIVGTSTLANLTSTAPITLPYNQVLNAIGTIVDNGSILINQNGGGAVALLNVNNTAVSGSGTWTLNSVGNNAQINGAFTQSAGHSIVGYGQINGTFINGGLINANVNGQSLIIAATTTNNGTAEATGGGTLTVSGAIFTAGTGSTLFVGNASTIAVTGGGVIAGGTITTNNGGNIYAANGTLNGVTISAGIATFVPNNTTLTIAGNLVNNGLLNVNGQVLGGSINGTGSFNMTTGAPAYFKLGASTGLSQQSSISLNGGAQFDIVNDRFAINYGVGNASPLATVMAYLHSGYNGGAWTGAGIVSSTAAVNPGYGIAYADSQYQASAGEIYLKVDRYGDANLDGVVNVNDLALLAQNYQKTGTTWTTGDFNYDGKTDVLDLGMLAQNYNKASALTAQDITTLDSIGGPMFAQALAEVGLTAPVPEPTAVGLFTLWAVAGLSRRRRGSVGC